MSVRISSQRRNNFIIHTIWQILICRNMYWTQTANCKFKWAKWKREIGRWESNFQLLACFFMERSFEWNEIYNLPKWRRMEHYKGCMHKFANCGWTWMILCITLLGMIRNCQKSRVNLVWMSLNIWLTFVKKFKSFHCSTKEI